MNEMWKSITDHPFYEVSNLGRIRSLDRTVRCGPGKGTRKIAGRVLKPSLVHGTGYMQVDLNRTRHSLHRLVAFAWCDGYFPGAVVDHLNTDPTDNRASNLEWVTQTENTRRSTAPAARIWRDKFSSDHPTSKAVISTCMTTGAKRVWPSGMDAVRAGFTSSSISRACRGLADSHAGYRWRYAEHSDLTMIIEAFAAKHGVDFGEGVEA